MQVSWCLAVFLPITLTSFHAQANDRVKGVIYPSLAPACTVFTLFTIFTKFVPWSPARFRSPPILLVHRLLLLLLEPKLHCLSSPFLSSRGNWSHELFCEKRKKHQLHFLCLSPFSLSCASARLLYFHFLSFLFLSLFFFFSRSLSPPNLLFLLYLSGILFFCMSFFFSSRQQEDKRQRERQKETR